MRMGAMVACGLLACAVTAHAQSRCVSTRAVTDSAREDALQVLNSSSSLVTELRQEQSMTAPDALSSIQVVRDVATCAKLATTLGRSIAPHVRYAVLRIGTMYYVRDPDQQLATGVFADTAYHVLMRLGPAMSNPVSRR